MACSVALVVWCAVLCVATPVSASTPSPIAVPAPANYGWVVSLVVQEGYMYALFAKGLCIYKEVGGGGGVTVQGELELQENSNMVALVVAGDTAYAGGAGVVVIDVSNRAEPKRLGRYELLQLNNIMVDSDKMILGVRTSHIFTIPHEAPYDTRYSKVGDGPSMSQAIAGREGKVYVGGDSAVYIFYTHDVYKVGAVARYEDTALGELKAAQLRGEVLFVGG
eukprot:Sspe_Gene.109022::Locus_88320_Transcript_1_1_Confidence_1.000_Length_706::g.109022::m.109022